MLEYISIGLMILTKSLVCASVLFVITGTLIEINFRFHPKVWDGCHDLMQKVMRFKVLAIFSVFQGYRICFWYISKDEAINLLTNAD